MKKLLNLTVVMTALMGTAGCSCVESLNPNRLCGRREGGHPLMPGLGMQAPCANCPAPCAPACNSCPPCSTGGSPGVAMIGGTACGCDSCNRGGAIIGGAAKVSGGEVISEGYLPAPTVTPGPGE